MSNFYNRKPRFGAPLFQDTAVAGLSAAKDCLAGERLYVAAAGVAGCVAVVKVWGLVRMEDPGAVVETGAPTTLAPTTGAPMTMPVPTTEPPVTDPDILDTEQWVYVGQLTLTVPASEVNAPDSVAHGYLRAPVGTIDIQAYTKFRLELISTTQRVTIWGASAEASV